MSHVALIGDIGGTNARFALAKPNGLGYADERVYACQQFSTPEAAINQYLSDVEAAAPTAMCLAIAGPVVDGKAELTNSNWTLNRAHLGAAFACNNVRLINDFEAVALSLPRLSARDLLPIGVKARPDLTSAEHTVAVLGPGTGLGVSIVVKRQDQTVTLATEGGHAGFAPESATQLKVLKVLQAKFERVSVERLISGTGLENIYWALTEGGNDVPSAAAIFQRRQIDPIATDAIALFYEILGQVAGDIALVTGAFDGVYLAGGIAQRYPTLLANSRFRAGFENKGRHAQLTECIPTALITHPQPGLLGACEFAADT